VAAKGWAKWATSQGLACLKLYIVAVVFLTYVLLSETDNNEEGIRKFSIKACEE
jgi:hypothetical protein